TRLVASTRLQGPEARIDLPAAEWVELLRQALYASKIVSYAQGLDLMRTMSAQRGWNLDLGAIARLWRGGCIIRAQFLNRIAEAHADGQAPASLMLAPYFETALNGAQAAWRRVVAQAMLAGVPVPAMSASLAFFDAFRSARLPADLLQAQRDFFGAHTYERIDRPAGQCFHTVWPEVQG
ncbi:MAG: 6-phosphogluconate dehydrogenase, partial [Pseudomonadota bacterium]|nr:6-phosphogluconate dehydrogenase [Pseudomonadota bacterium]